MRLRSTRAPAGEVGLREAVLSGLAPDGGLYLPCSLPTFSENELSSLRGRSFREVAEAVALRLFGEEVGATPTRDLIREALAFPVPVRELEPGVSVVELFHGPTGSFKDTGARFLSRLLPALNPEEGSPVLVVVATSGDTGGAVAHAFRGVSGARAVVLFPEGRVSPVQRAQIEAGGRGTQGVRAISVDGSFDDCQRLVKATLADPELRRRVVLTSANSINAGRLLPQICHYVHGWAQLDPSPPELVFSVPTGNVGHLVSGVMARRMGVPIARLVAATNANDGLVRYLHEGTDPEGPSRATLSSAMDVARPSNLERLVALFGGDRSLLREEVEGRSYTDDETLAAMSEVHERLGYVMDPHTAVGWLGLRDALAHDREGRKGVVLATAHPAKFPETVVQAVGVEPTWPSHWEGGTPSGQHEDGSSPLPPTMAALRPILEALVEE